MTAAAYPGVVKTTHGKNRGTLDGLVGANQKIPAGAYIALIAGFWVNVTSTLNLEGRIAKCLKDVDNTGGADGALAIEVQVLGNRNLELITNDTGSPVAATDLGEDVYFLDNATVTPNSGLLASLIARITDIRTQFLAHAAGTGTYHGAADPASYTIAVPTTAATVYTACGQLKTAGIAHAPITASSVHGGIDLATVGALSALVVPTALDDARVFVEQFASIFFGASGHTSRIVDSIHGAADATNVLTSTAATAARSVGGKAWGFYQSSFSDVDTTRVWVEVY